MTKKDIAVDEESLFDAIAALLPPEQRERFYRRMAHLKDLSPDDEMLQIAEAMGFLALIIREAPLEVAKERARLDELSASSAKSLRAFQEATVAYHSGLDARLQELPNAIAKGISPEVIAANIRESLRQRFQDTGMPQTAEMLKVLARDLTIAASTLQTSVNQFSDPKTGAAQRVRDGLDDMELRLTEAANRIHELSAQVRVDISRAKLLFIGGLCLASFVLGVWVHWRFGG